MAGLVANTVTTVANTVSGAVTAKIASNTSISAFTVDSQATVSGLIPTLELRHFVTTGPNGAELGRKIQQKYVMPAGGYKWLDLPIMTKIINVSL